MTCTSRASARSSASCSWVMPRSIRRSRTLAPTVFRIRAQTARARTWPRNELAENCCQHGGGAVLKIGQQISVAVNAVGSEGVAPM